MKLKRQNNVIRKFTIIVVASFKRPRYLFDESFSFLCESNSEHDIKTDLVSLFSSVDSKIHSLQIIVKFFRKVLLLKL
jgi:hypothetical protein